MGIKFAASVLLVRDVAISRKFYESVLEQAVEADYVECLVFSGGLAIWDEEYAQNLIFGAENPASVGRSHNFELYFESDNLDELNTKLEEAGVEWVHRMVEQPWGQRVIRFFDPDQHIIEIAEPLTKVAKRLLEQGMTVEAISAKTSLPVEVVLRCCE